MKIPIKQYKKGAYIYLSGQQPLEEFYIIKSGQIKLTKTNPILGFSEEIRDIGYIFGIIQCITEIAEEETAESVTDCELFVIQKSNIEKVLTNHKKVFLRILSEYSEILRKLDTDLTNYNFFPSIENRKRKIFDIVNKHIKEKEEKKASHLLLSLMEEYKDDNDIIIRIKNILMKLPKVELLKKEGIISEKKFQKDTIIFTEFEQSDCFFIIKNGKVKITKLSHEKEILLAILGETDIFGEMSVLNDKPRNATAQTIEETELMIIDKKGIDKLPGPIFLKLLLFLSKRIWLVQQQLICYKLPLTIAKIYFMLTSKIKQVFLNPQNQFANPFIFKFSEKELYQMIDYDYDKKRKTEIEDFLKDKNIEFFQDSIKIKKIKDLFDKNAYYFSRALITYNSNKFNF